MSEVKRRYFVAKSERAKSVLLDAAFKEHERVEMAREVAKKHGAFSTLEWPGYKPHALAFDETHSERKKGFLTPTKLREEDVYSHRPNPNSRIGQQLIEDFERIGAFDFSDFCCNELGVYNVVYSSDGGRHWSVAYTPNQVFLVFSIPLSGNAEEDEGIVIPDDFQEIKKSQWIAITEEGETNV